jgi:hypothetical protein
MFLLFVAAVPARGQRSNDEVISQADVQGRAAGQALVDPRVILS